MTGKRHAWRVLVAVGVVVAGVGLLEDLAATFGPCDVPVSFVTLPLAAVLVGIGVVVGVAGRTRPRRGAQGPVE